MKTVVLALGLVWATSTLAQPVPIAQPPATDAGYAVQDPVSIPTSGKASLSAIIVRKPGQVERLPTILFYTTYDEGPGDAIFGKTAVDHGYVGVVAYARGIRTKAGDYVPYEHEGDDTHAVIDWISRQPWSDGRVAMYGGSYTGFAQWAATRRLHPALKTIVPQVAIMPGFDTPTENGVCSSMLCFDWAHSILGGGPLPNDFYDQWYAKGTPYRTLDAQAGKSNRIFQRWLDHPADDAYWRAMTPTPKEFARLDIPVLTTTGYYDGAQIGALEYLKRHTRYNAHAQHYLVIGPYDHRGAQRKAATELMGYTIDPVAEIDMVALAYAWFDYVLRGAPKPALLQDRINYEVMGANTWRHAPSLAAMADDTLTLYLADRAQGKDHALTPQRPDRAGFVPQVVDFRDRTTQNNYFTPFIVNPTLDASNGLVYATEPFAEPFSIDGALSGELGASIDKRDMDVSVSLYEGLPDGTYFYLTHYLGRASYAHDRGKRRLLRPGVRETIPFDATRLVARRIGKGSRLVVVLNVNKHPYDIINYGTGKEVGEERIEDAGAPLHVKWYADSYIRLPIVRGTE